MSTSKHMDRICMAAIAAALVLTVLFINGAGLGLVASGQAMGYESRLFTTDQVHRIDIVMNGWDTFIAACENEEYSACSVVIDGESYKNVGIRAKGNTSLSSVSAMGSRRYSFKLEFDRYEKGKSYYGLDKLCLNNLIQDNTMMKDYLVYQMMGGFGVEAPLCSFVYITVNGEDWGLYLAVEGVEDGFLRRNYGSDEGELYKPDSTGFGGGRGNGKGFRMEDVDLDLNGAGNSADSSDNGQNAPGVFPPGWKDGAERPDFAPGGQAPQPNGERQNALPPGNDAAQNAGMPQTPWESGARPGGMGSDDVKLQYIDDDPESYPNLFDNAKTDVSSADQQRLIGALKNLSSCTDLENTLEMERVLRYFVVHNFVCNGDSYTGSMVHNYYLHEKDGKLSMIPWDYNLAFGTFQGNSASSAVNASIDDPVDGGYDDRPMLAWIFSDGTYTDQYHALFRAFLEEWLDSGKLEQMIAATAELIRPYVEQDPGKFCTVEEFELGVSAVTRFVTLRAQAVSRQLEGDAQAVDTGDLKLSDMGSMSSGMGRGGGLAPDQETGGLPPDNRGTPPDETGMGGSNGQNLQRPGKEGFSPQGAGGAPESLETAPGGTGASAWVWLGVSVLVLAAGLVLAVKKKF